MAELAGGQIGPEAKYSLKFDGGKLVADVEYAGADGAGKLVLSYNAASVINVIIDKAEEVIPGDQKALAALLKSFLEGVMK